MELSEAKKVLKEEIWRCTKFEDSRKRIAIEIILKALDNSISKDEIRNKMEKLNKLIKNAEPIEAVFMIKQQQALHELLLGEE